jgi:hypothetical protein
MLFSVHNAFNMIKLLGIDAADGIRTRVYMVIATDNGFVDILNFWFRKITGF